MEGAQVKAERAYDMSIAESWHTAMFSALAQVGKLKRLKSYLVKREGDQSTLASAMAFFNMMKAKGVPVKVYRTPPKVRKTAE